MSKVLIYRNELLPFSETFILSEAMMLQRFLPIFVGLKRARGNLDLSQYPVITLSRAETYIEKIRRRAFIRTGRANGFVAEIRKQKSDLIHAHFGVDACAALPIAHSLKMPLIVTLHGYDIMRNEAHMRSWPETRIYLRRKKALWQYASLFLCVSEQIRRHALRQGFPEKKLRLHHIGVRRTEVPLSNKSRSENLVLFVGRLVEKKGCIHLIRAMSRVERSIADAKLLVVGDGPLRAELEQEAAKLLKRYLFVGAQPQDVVRAWMRQASVLAVPSVRASDGDGEGLPTVMCEAQAEGLPVATFAAGGVVEGLPENLRSGLPEEGDDEGLAEKIIRLLKDDKTWQHASDLGRQYIKLNFDLQKQVRILEDIYEDVITGYHGRLQ
jgi:glycosyltransferase involved in cell wall biosynthesis